ncbi:anti-sigma factor [Streptomonospora salina]|uniref:Regulator of SigK n=1 Tax=Streptomonospora salina TaxID=104205 RepID=A0A841EG30_9ACTN|nr:anti-sigma factor [Streptomonospora salina]MBB6001254.1 anti-sigma-K factor RskA [Streptomonospora salina]
MSAREHDVHGLTAAYAVDALSGAERERARRHVDECADCRRDLGEFRATTVRLAYAQAERPPEAVWERLRAAVSDVRPLPPDTSDSRPEAESGDGGRGSDPGGGADGGARVLDTASRRRGGRLPWLLAAACAVLAVVLGATIVSMQQRMAEMSEHTAEVEALLASSDTSMAEQPVSHSRAQATVFTSDRNDTVMIMVKGLPVPPEDMDYQMWYVDDSGMRSAGMLERSGAGMYSGMAGDMGSARQLGISLEPAGGMPEPSEEPMKVEL